MVIAGLFKLALSFQIQAGAPQGAPRHATAPRVPPPTDSSAVAVRADVPPVIDGRDDDAVWREAPPITQFREWKPTEGKAPRFRTEAKVAYDAANLYVFVRAYDAASRQHHPAARAARHLHALGHDLAVRRLVPRPAHRLRVRRQRRRA